MTDLNEKSLEEALVAIKEMMPRPDKLIDDRPSIIMMHVPTKNLLAYVDGLENSVIELKEIAFALSEYVDDLWPYNEDRGGKEIFEELPKIEELQARLAKYKYEDGK